MHVCICICKKICVYMYNVYIIHVHMLTRNSLRLPAPRFKKWFSKRQISRTPELQNLRTSDSGQHNALVLSMVISQLPKTLKMFMFTVFSAPHQGYAHECRQCQHGETERLSDYGGDHMYTSLLTCVPLSLFISFQLLCIACVRACGLLIRSYTYLPKFLKHGVCLYIHIYVYTYVYIYDHIYIYVCVCIHRER